MSTRSRGPRRAPASMMAAPSPRAGGRAGRSDGCVQGHPGPAPLKGPRKGRFNAEHQKTSEGHQKKLRTSEDRLVQRVLRTSEDRLVQRVLRTSEDRLVQPDISAPDIGRSPYATFWPRGDPFLRPGPPGPIQSPAPRASPCPLSPAPPEAVDWSERRGRSQP